MYASTWQESIFDLQQKLEAAKKKAATPMKKALPARPQSAAVSATATATAAATAKPISARPALGNVGNAANVKVRSLDVYCCIFACEGYTADFVAYVLVHGNVQYSTQSSSLFNQWGEWAGTL